MLSPPDATRAAHEATVSTLVACGLLEAVQQAGVSKDVLLRELAWPLDRIQRVDTRLTLQELLQLCEAAVRVTGDPALG